MKISKIFTALALSIGLSATSFAGPTLLNVSYDPTRELYQDFNKAFADHWKKKTGEEFNFKQSYEKLWRSTVVMLCRFKRHYKYTP